MGGYYYATNVKEFLRLDADVLCVGEGEVRLPQIVQRLVAGQSVSNIPGLYLPDAEGVLRHTGHVEPLDLQSLSRPNWDLSGQIDPPINLERATIEFGVETQRGCIFKCEFCNYRTLASRSR